jgi:hypothetical protein
MSGLLRGLTQRLHFESGRFREVFLKAAHVLGWMSSMAQAGTPPIRTIDGQPYTEPFPGLLSRSRPKIADVPFPHRSDVLFIELGMFAVGCKLYEFAWQKLNQARDLAQSGGLSTLSHVIDLELAELAVHKERYEEALQLAISGLRASSAVRNMREQGVDALTAQGSFEDIWQSLTREQRRDAEHGLFWTIIGPAITRLFAKTASSIEAYSDVIAELETIFRKYEHELADPQYWYSILYEFRLAFSPSTTRETIREQIQNLPEGGFPLVLFYLALSRTPNASLAEICGTQAVAFDFLFRALPASKLMAEDIATYVLRYWTEVVETQGFALRNPQLFKRSLESLRQPTFENVAKLLLLASDATGSQLSDSLRQSLLNSAGSSTT